MSNSELSVDHQKITLPQRIAFCITDLDPGGAEKALLQIVTHLDRRRWDPVVFCLGPEAELAAEFRRRGIVTLCYGARRWRSWGVFAWLTNELKFYRPALLQCFLFHANIVGRVAGRLAGVPLILAGHRVAEREKKWHLMVERVTSRLVDHHVCVSKGVAQRLMQATGIPESRISVIPNGVTIPLSPLPSANLREELGFPKEALIVLAVGRLHPQKGFLDLLKVFRTLRDRVPAARLVILGEGPQRGDLESAIHRLNLGGDVRLPGFRRDVYGLMRQSQVLAVSSQWEGMSNVMLEGLAAGLPIVTTPVEGVDELVRSFPEFITVSSTAETRFVTALEECLTTDRNAGEVGRRVQTVLNKEFAWSVIAQEYERLYEKMVV